MVYIFRFLGRMPRGRFEYMCDCGNYEITDIPNDKDNADFNCIKCGSKISVWEQNTHWHATVTIKK